MCLSVIVCVCNEERYDVILAVGMVCVCVCLCRKFNKTIEILQGDIEILENEKMAAERKLDQEAQKAMRVDTTSTRRLRGSSFGNALGLREMRGGAEGAAGSQQPGAQQAPVDAAAASPLILARVCHQSGKYRHTNSKKRKLFAAVILPLVSSENKPITRFCTNKTLYKAWHSHMCVRA